VGVIKIRVGGRIETELEKDILDAIRALTGGWGLCSWMNRDILTVIF
jgi:hypothetical protein